MILFLLTNLFGEISVYLHVFKLFCLLIMMMRYVLSLTMLESITVFIYLERRIAANWDNSGVAVVGKLICLPPEN